MFEFKGVVERSGGGVKEKNWELSPPPPPFLLKNEICSIIDTNLYSIVLVGHAFGSVHIHLLEF